MNYRKVFLFNSLAFFSIILIFAQEKNFKTMNLHDFMEDYVEVAEKDYKKGKKEKLIQLLEYVPNLAPEENKEEWKTIVSKHLSENTPLKSCKSCHSQFKKSYKKTYRKKLLDIPSNILE